ncbi:Extracellular serine proteinase [Gracilariopsis chorda]|uniref:Extracellular serine proteinase n=1 Tax=Gracilariopsis chorda TaxID=448386 RepID=A0A2V3IP96_9FLOR|nr:Extracellular serine proteinase [Gracilariopsis chorda]|eukprot:PXF43911.1 Extracellular serine proteinase [Gracilariopsis chorda]
MTLGTPWVQFVLVWVFLNHIVSLLLATELSENVPVLYPGSLLQNSTVGLPRLININGIVRGGQFLFKVDIHHSISSRSDVLGSRISVSTCSNLFILDTILIAYSRNPLLAENPNLEQPIDMNDNNCGKQSTIEFLMQTLPVHVLVTGYRGAEGPFEVQIKTISTAKVKKVPWGLDRIDQRNLPLDEKFSILRGGHSVFVYVLDSGIRVSHKEFLEANGSSRVLPGVDIVDRKPSFTDETGHGTHVAAIIAGRTYGVAKNASIVSVRVTDRNGLGYTSRLIEGLQWSVDDIEANNRTPALIVMSLSTKLSQTLNDAVEEAKESGLAVITAAGNAGNDSCLFSPGSSTSSISVGATRFDDTRAAFSNLGKCVNIFAPGEGITSAWHTGDEAEETLSGTSAACPHVAGTIAVLLAENPTMTPSQIESVIYSTATYSVVRNYTVETGKNSTNPKFGLRDSNRLTYVRAIPAVPTDGDPEEGTMFLYVIYGLSSSLSGTCNLSRNKISAIARLVESHGLISSSETSVSIKLCCLSSSSLHAGCDEGGTWNMTRMIIRVQTRDILAGAVFESLLDFTRSHEKQLILEDVMRSKVNLLAEPWVVDARGLKYWTAPTIMHPVGSRIPTSVIIALSIAAGVSLFLAVGFIAYLYYRRRKAKEIAEQEVFRSMAVNFELSSEKRSNLTNLENDPPMDYVREGMKRTNTELHGNIFRNANPDLALPTPRPDVPISPTGPFSAQSFRRLKRAISNIAGDRGTGNRNTSSRVPNSSVSTRFQPFGPNKFPSFITKLTTPRNKASNRRPASGIVSEKEPDESLPCRSEEHARENPGRHNVDPSSIPDEGKSKISEESAPSQSRASG